MEVIILRGISGSGKDTWITRMVNKKLASSQPVPRVEVCSADHYHIKDGRYDFKPENAGEAHRKCFLKFLDRVHEEDNHRLVDYLIVNNTNTTVWEIAPYYQVAVAFNLPVKIIRIYCDPITGFRRNLHDVPTGVILRQYRNINNEVLPSHWIEEVVFPDTL